MPMMAVPGEEVDGRPYPRSLIRERAVPRQIMVNAAEYAMWAEDAPRFGWELAPPTGFASAL